MAEVETRMAPYPMGNPAFAVVNPAIPWDGKAMSNDDSAEAGWLADERRKVMDFLRDEGCRHAGVADWPAFQLSPHLALWAVLSPLHAGRVGWWAISGDVPTDYMSSSDGEHPADALRYFSSQWKEVAGYLRRGEPHPTLDFGDPQNAPAIAEELEERAAALLKLAEELDEEAG